MLDILKETATGGGQNWIQILVLLTALALVPTMLIMTTSFTRIVIVFSFVRNALGTQQMPPNQILIGIALFLTIFIMSPVLEQINDEAIQPYLDNKINQEEAFENAEEPLKGFMLKQTREKDLALFIDLSRSEKPQKTEDVSITVLIPAFIISELRIAFQIGFMIYVPFLMIDFIVASILMSMGMMMVPPVMISLPFKILLFVMVDGWYLLTNSIVRSFN
ncbi:MAG: flagellar biosynthesis protein flip [delta proteobacterium ML8_D]|jgi:flagellar biosynthesis protein FliP|nr:MAG: flagellar biosynthesis protein flip [delta proteobacterium ML8_D]